MAAWADKDRELLLVLGGIDVHTSGASVTFTRRWHNTICAECPRAGIAQPDATAVFAIAAPLWRRLLHVEANQKKTYSITRISVYRPMFYNLQNGIGGNRDSFLLLGYTLFLLRGFCSVLNCLLEFEVHTWCWCPR